MLKPSIKHRLSAARSQVPEDALALRPGDRRDYQQLAQHHYRAASPATFMRVLVLEHDQPTVVGRFLGRTGEKQVVGVLVESLPSLSCRLREEATGHRFASIENLRMRARALNREMRCISRVVVHPQWRGLGVAVRLVRAALSSATTPLTEAIAAMGHVNPFFEHAGMTAYCAARSEHDLRFIAALESCGMSAWDVAMTDAMIGRLGALPAPRRQFIERELRRWHQRTTLRRGADLRAQVVAARQWLNGDAVYYLSLNDFSGGAS